MKKTDLESWLGTRACEIESLDIFDDAAQGLAHGQTSPQDSGVITGARKALIFSPSAERLGFDIYRYEGFPWFFVKPPGEGFHARSIATNVVEQNGGFVLDLSSPDAAIAVLNAQNEGLVFGFDGRNLHTAMMIHLVSESTPELNSPLEELSLEVAEQDPWLSDKTFELLNASSWGEVVGMGLLGRHRPVTRQNIEAIQSLFSHQSSLILPESRERLWFKGLPQASKQWVFEELRFQTEDLIGALEDIAQGAQATEEILLERDNIECVIWISDHHEELVNFADDLGASLIGRFPEAQDEQLLRAASDYGDMWWSQTVRTDFSTVNDDE